MQIRADSLALPGCFGCGHGLSRRGFLQRCGAAAGAGALAPVLNQAAEPKPKKVRVALVFLTDSTDRECWPYPGFDCAGRHRQIIRLLGERCPQVEFVPIEVGKPVELDKALAVKDTVDGYLVYTTTLTWPFTNCVVQLGKLGKPALVADEYLGGSGVFLIGCSGLRRQGAAVAAVSSTRDEDLVAVARQSADLNTSRA